MGPCLYSIFILGGRGKGLKPKGDSGNVLLGMFSLTVVVKHYLRHKTNYIVRRLLV